MERSASDRVTMHLEAEAAPRMARPLPGTAFQMALLGDFSARASRGAAPRDPGDQRAWLVDRDNVEALLERLAPELHARPSADEPALVLRPRELEDFHPDRLYQGLPFLASLRDLRRRLADPRSAPQAIAEMLGGRDQPSDAAPAAAPPRSGAGLLDAILTDAGEPGTLEPLAAPPSGQQDLLQRFVRQALAPHLVPGEDPRQSELLNQLDEAVATRIRAILHDRSFQALESLWRGVQLLVRRLDTGSELKVFLIDVTRAELEADLDGQRELTESGLYRLLVEGTAMPGATPWSLLVGCYTFGADPADTALLARLGALARAAGAPWLAGARPLVAGWPDFATRPEVENWTPPPAAWNELRATAAARWIGLAAPRFLLREPYGAEGETCELFDFEELPRSPDHEAFLWGNPALAAATLLGQSFVDDGWSLRPGSRAELAGLPLWLQRDEDGEAVAVPCAEALLSERSAQKMLDTGVMPLASLKDRDAVRLLSFQSVARPPAPLAGRWR